MGFLSQKNINFLNMHGSMMRLIDLIMWTFGIIFLYEIGLSIPYIFFVTVSIYFLRIPFRFLIIPFLQTLGLKKTLVLSIIFRGLAPLLLTQVTEPNIWLVYFTFYFALADAFYWTAFHCYYTLSGNQEHRGKHFAVMESSKLLIMALAPYLSGLFIERSDFFTYFYFVIPVVILAAVPVLFCAPINIHIDFKSWREDFFTFGGKSHGLYAGMSDIPIIAWPLMVFMTIGTVSSFGAIVTIGLLVQAILYLGLGYFIDKGYLWRIFRVGLLAELITFITMASLPLSFNIAVILESAFALAAICTNSGFSVALYNDAHTSRHPVWYWIFSEMWVDIGSCTMRGAAGLLLLAGVPLNYVLYLTLICGPVFYIVMKRHVHKVAAV